MPFGKHKGKPMGEVPKDYLQWLLKQDGFTEKNKEMAKYINGEPDAATPKELENIQVASQLLLKAPVEFSNWWSVAYGERLRKQGELMYVPYLRVALEAWLHCEGIQLARPKTVIPQPPAHKVIPPPFVKSQDVTADF